MTRSQHAALACAAAGLVLAFAITGPFGMLPVAVRFFPSIAVAVIGLFAWSALASNKLERWVVRRSRIVRFAASIALAWTSVIISVVLAGFTNVLLYESFDSDALYGYLLKPLLAIGWFAILPATLLGIVHRALADR